MSSGPQPATEASCSSPEAPAPARPGSSRRSGIEAEAGECQFLIGRCHDTSQTDAYTPLVEILETVERRLDPDEFRLVVGDSAPEVARLLPHLGSRDLDASSRAERPAVEQRRYLFMSVRDVIARLAAPRPIVVLLDDLHWADTPSLMFLEHLAAELASLPILVVGTYRSEALSATVPLHPTLARLHQRHLVETIEVGPLRPADIADLLQAVGAAPPPDSLVRALHDATQGNPFFLGEVVQQLVERDVLFDESGWRSDLDRLDFDVPESVRLTIESRLQSLQDDTQRMLTAVCLIGREFGFDLLHAVCELSEDALVDALDEAERARMLVSRADSRSIRFSFAHELVRQTLLSQISDTRRQRLHIRVADALEQVNAATLPEHAAAIAYHLLEAGPFADRDRTVRWLTLAGERALETAAFEEAVRHFRLVLATVDDVPAARAPLLERVATAERSLGHLDEALSLWGDAIDAYEAVPDPASAARVCLDAAIQVAWWRRGGDVSRLVDRGLDLLGTGDESTRAGLLAVAGMSSSERGPYERGEELLSEASALATAGGDLQVLGLTLYARAAHHFAYQEFRQTVEVGVESIEYLRRVGDLWNLANVLGYVGSSLGWLGRFDEAADLGAEGEALAHRLGNWSAFVFSEQARGFSDIGSRPEVSTLEDRGRQALDLGRDMGFPWLSSVGHARVGLAAFWRGEWREAVERFDELARFEGTGTAGGSMGRLLLLVHAYLGDRAETVELIEQARPDFPTSARPAPACAWTLAATAVEALRMLGDDGAAGELYDTMSRAGRGDRWRDAALGLPTRLDTARHRCRMQWRLGCRRGALRGVVAAGPLAAHVARAAGQLVASTRRCCSTVVDRPTERPRNELLRGAIDEYSSFGMPRHAQLARDMAPLRRRADQ